MTTAHSGSGDLGRSMELLWQGREQSGRGPKPTLSLDRIVSAAVALADREGIAALSMRKVAAELGVGTMSLYRYVPGKGELLDLMLDHVNGPREVVRRSLAGKPWREALEQVAEGTWELYIQHPWLLQVNQSRPVLGPNSLASFDATLAPLRDLGLTSREKVGVIMTINHYVTGTARTYVLQQQTVEESGVSDEEFWAAQGPAVTAALQSGEYPEVAGLAEDAFTIGGREAMRFGLAPLLNGLSALVESRQRSGPPAWTAPAPSGLDADYRAEEHGDAGNAGGAEEHGNSEHPADGGVRATGPGD
jgi:AcrR family transcriptional regulator